jgi:hypothetical protein
MSERAPWVKASLMARIPGTNAHASATTPIVGLFVHFSWATFGLVALVTLVVVILSAKGLSASWLLFRAKARLRDNKVHSRPVFLRRRMQRMVSTDVVPLQILRSDQ